MNNMDSLAVEIIKKKNVAQNKLFLLKLNMVKYGWEIQNDMKLLNIFRKYDFASDEFDPGAITELQNELSQSGYSLTVDFQEPNIDFTDSKISFSVLPDMIKVKIMKKVVEV